MSATLEVCCQPIFNWWRRVSTHPVSRRNAFLYAGALLGAIILIIVLVAIYTSGKSHQEEVPLRGSEALRTVPLIDGCNNIAENLKTIKKSQLVNFNFTNALTADKAWAEISQTDLESLQKGIIGAQFWTVSVNCIAAQKDAVTQTLEQIDLIHRLINANQKLEFVNSAVGIKKTFTSGRIGSLIAVSGGHSIDGRLSVLRMFYDLGVRYLSLTSDNCSTAWAEATNPNQLNQEPKGLNEFGEKVVKEMNRLGLLIDLSGTSNVTQKAVFKTSKAPVIFSHSNAYTLCENQSNVQDDVLKLLANQNGLIMVSFDPYKLHKDPKKAELKHVIAHIVHLRNIISINNIGIGAGFDQLHIVAKGLENVTTYKDLFDQLALQTNPVWTQEDLQKLAGNNLIRVLEAVEKVRDGRTKEHPDNLFEPKEEYGDASQTVCYTDFKERY